MKFFFPDFLDVKAGEYSLMHHKLLGLRALQSCDESVRERRSRYRKYRSDGEEVECGTEPELKSSALETMGDAVGVRVREEHRFKIMVVLPPSSLAMLGIAVTTWRGITCAAHHLRAHLI